MNPDPIADLAAHLDLREERIASAEKARLAGEKSRTDSLEFHRNAAASALKSSVLPELENLAEHLRKRGIAATALIQKISPMDALFGDEGETIAILELKVEPSNKHSARFIAKATETSWSVRCTVESHDHALLNAFKIETWPGVEEPELNTWTVSKSIEFIKLTLP